MTPSYEGSVYFHVTCTTDPCSDHQNHMEENSLLQRSISNIKQTNKHSKALLFSLRILFPRINIPEPALLLVTHHFLALSPLWISEL